VARERKGAKPGGGDHGAAAEGHALGISPRARYAHERLEWRRCAPSPRPEESRKHGAEPLVHGPLHRVLSEPKKSVDRNRVQGEE